MGRAIRNRSHVALPQEQQYVETHVLVNGFQEATQDITRGSVDQIGIYERCLNYQYILQFESLIHSVAKDVPVYGQRFI